MADSELDGLLAEQVAYYRSRAGEYDATSPLGAHLDVELLSRLEALAPYGRVLELACRTGQWTAPLARQATSITAVDAAPEALALCRQRVPEAHLIEADLFTWRPTARYDLVLFAGWLSHVPPQRFASFWSLVADCLTPDGQAFVIDERPAVAAIEQALPNSPTPAVRRRLTTGAEFRAVKVLYEPSDLESRLSALGWNASVTAAGWRFYTATAKPRP